MSRDQEREPSELVESLPEHWRRDRRNTYQHVYLDVELRVISQDAEGTVAEHTDAETLYTIWVTEGIHVGASEACFEPPEPITSETDARDWTVALMMQIDQEYSPDDHYYVSTAMNSVLGEQKYSSPGKMRVRDEDECPACKAPVWQFRGMSNYDQIKAHFEYMDDEQHEGWEISVVDSE